MSDVIAYVYEAGQHCPACAYARFGDELDNPDTEDREGNPIGVVAPWDEIPASGIYCDDCLGEIVAPVQVIVQTWFERDRAQVSVHMGREGDANDQTVCEWWDEEVGEAVEDGFLDPHDYKGSALRYADEFGLLKWNGETIKI